MPTSMEPWWIWVEESCDGYDYVHQHAQYTFEIIALSVAQEVTDHQDREDQHDGIEEMEVEVHAEAEPPADDNDEWCIEESSL